LYRRKMAVDQKKAVYKKGRKKLDAVRRKAKKASRKAKQKKLREQQRKIQAFIAKEKTVVVSDEQNEAEFEPIVEEMRNSMSVLFEKLTRPPEPEPTKEPQNAEFESALKKARDSAKKFQRPLNSTTEPEEDKPLSNKKRKQQQRLKIAELKQLVDRPDLVEEHDCNASDPRLLLFLKCQRNTIPVPEHWGRKRKYLQGKRGFEKPPFELPSFIRNTGITAIRDEQLRIYSEKTRKQKQRTKVRGSKGKMAINYNTLHDAFFIHQTKPPLTHFGDIYYECKEKEMAFRKFRPGLLSDRLKKALGLPAVWRVIAPGGIPVYDDFEDEKPREGTTLVQGTEMTWEESAKDGEWIKIFRPVAGWIRAKVDGKRHAKQIEHNCPTPWLIAQQRFGPPPAYPDLKIPGLNAPIPPGHEYGYNEMQWGKPPVDRNGHPLYGNPFDTYYEPDYNNMGDGNFWGQIEEISDDEESSDEESSEESDDKEEEEKLPEGVLSGTLSGQSGITSGIGSTSGTLSASSQSQTDFNLRKSMDSTPDSTSNQLYQVLQQKDNTIKSNEVFGSTHVYDIKKMDQADEPSSGRRFDMSINPDEIGQLDEQKLKRKFEDAMAVTSLRNNTANFVF